MSKKQKMTRKSLEAFFDRAYAPDSITAGILRANRPNTSVDWNEKGDTRRSKKYVESFVKEFGAAVKIVASRKA